MLKGRRARVAIVMLLAALGLGGYYLQRSFARSQERSAEGLKDIFIRPFEKAIKPIADIGQKYDVVIAPQEPGQMLVWGRSIDGLRFVESAGELRSLLKDVPAGTAYVTSMADEGLPQPKQVRSPQEQEKTRIELEAILRGSGFRMTDRPLGSPARRQQ
jgi:hypothetical protein